VSKIVRAIIHCAATPNGHPFTAEDIRRWHTAPKPEGRGWSHAGYHFVIELDGKIAPLVPLDDDQFIEPWEIANGARGFNSDSIHICMIGTDAFTRAQWQSLGQLREDIADLYCGISFYGHNEFSSKNCPGFYVGAWLTSPESIEALHLLEVQS